MNTESIPQIRRWRAFAVLAVSFFMTVVDLTIVNVALPTIGRDLHFSESNLQWVMTAYAITFGGFLLLGGLATSDGFLIAMRGLQGFGAAVVLPAALSIVMNLFAEGAERNRALGLWGGARSNRDLPGLARTRVQVQGSRIPTELPPLFGKVVAGARGSVAGDVGARGGVALGPGWLCPWLLGGPGFTSGCGGLGGGVVVDGADERLDGGVERLDAAGGAAEDQRALERRDGQVGEDRGAVGGDAQRFEAGNQRHPPPREHAVEVGAELLVAGGQLQDHGGDRAAALVAGAFQAAGEDLGQRADQRPGVIGVAGGLVAQLLELLTRPGDVLACHYLRAHGEVEVGPSAGRAAFADHVGEGGGVVAALAEQLGGGVEHPGAAVGASGHGPSLPLTYV